MTKPDTNISERTPAPWIVKESTSECTVLEKPYYYVAISATGGEKMADGDEYIATTPSTCSPDNHRRNIANGCLIAAAPDLFEALQGLLADIEEYQKINSLGGYDNHWQAMARLALAKVKGNK